MPKTHRVEQGECMVSIAEEHGFFWETLWNREENRALRERRRDPTVLLPGDVVFVPDRTVRDYTRPTGARHTFRVKNVPAKFNLRLLDEGGEARAGIAYVLTIDGVETRGSTDGEGWVRASIPPRARRGTLRLEGDDEPYDLELGHLDPVDTPRGALARLAQMGALAGSAGDDPAAFAAALRDFQSSHGLEPTGELDASTQNALRQAYAG